MIKREATNELLRLAKQFKAIAVTGPRQSGKTTLVRAVFIDKPYANLENPDTRMFAREDPRGFLDSYPDGAILDEVQRVPELFSYLQQILDEAPENGMFILTGSNNFLIQENISQSLAGRVAYLFLLPFSIAELPQKTMRTDALMFRGGYPALYIGDIDVSLYYANYIRTYLERDVRLLKNIGDLVAFEKFLRLCAGRTGQMLNMSSLAIEVGVDVKTISAWIGVLEASFIVFRLQPYHKNFNKRVVKMPKLYFYDTGLALALLGLENEQQLVTHPLRGSVFETLIVVELLKKRYNQLKSNNLYFWRDSIGNEIDILLDFADGQVPVEIKSGRTITKDFFKGLNYWKKLSGTNHGFLVYDGDSMQKRSDGFTVVPLKEMGDVDFKI